MDSARGGFRIEGIRLCLHDSQVSLWSDRGMVLLRYQASSRTCVTSLQVLILAQQSLRLTACNYNILKISIIICCCIRRHVPHNADRTCHVNMVRGELARNIHTRHTSSNILSSLNTPAS